MTGVIISMSTIYAYLYGNVLKACVFCDHCPPPLLLLSDDLFGRGTPSGLSGCYFSASRACFYTTFKQIMMETTCLKTVVGVSKGMLPVKYFCSS